VRARPHALGPVARRQGRDARAGRRQRPARCARHAWAAFANAGQCGGSVERVLCVPEATIASSPASCRRRAGCGRPVGSFYLDRPARRPQRVALVRALVDEAVVPATLHCGGADGETHYAPAVLAGDAGLRLAREEVRPGPRGRVGRQRGEGRRAGQRGARARRVGVDGRSLQGRHLPRVARGDGVDERPPGGALGAQIPWGGVGGAGIGAPAAPSPCARAPSRAWSPGTAHRPPGVVVSTTAPSSAPPAVAGLRSARPRP
jgi:hypothetical protein